MKTYETCGYIQIAVAFEDPAPPEREIVQRVHSIGQRQRSNYYEALYNAQLAENRYLVDVLAAEGKRLLESKAETKKYYDVARVLYWLVFVVFIAGVSAVAWVGR